MDRLSLLYEIIDSDAVVRIMNPNEVAITWQDGSGTILTWDDGWRWPDDGAAYRNAIDAACGY